MIGVTIIVSSIIYLTPGDPAKIMLGPQASQEAINKLRNKMDLDKPFYLRYIKWISGIVRGDFGRSLRRREDVLTIISKRIPATLKLGISALIITLILAVPTGIISAVKPNSILDNISRAFAVFWISMPSFWLGLILILILSIRLNIFPISGMGGSLATKSGWIHLALPAFAVGARRAAVIMRLTRSKMLEILNEEYIQTARSKGLPESLVIYRHAFRNVLIPIITLLGMQIPWIFSGAVIIERVFAWPGMGRLLVNSVFKRDYPLIQGSILIFALIVMIINIIIDISYAYIDPRIRYQ